jgi:HrpA-like RNA helicase
LDQDENEEHRAKQEEEIMVLISLLEERITKVSEEEHRISIPGREDLALHVVMDAASCYPSERYPTHAPSFFLSSSTLPSYIKLHLHAQLLRCFRDPERPEFQSTLESGSGGAIYLMTDFLEQELEIALENPPDVAVVTRYLLPHKEVSSGTATPRSRGPTRRNRARGPARIPTAADHDAVKKKYDSMRSNPGYEKMMQVRRKLPAWNERGRLVQLLQSNRVVVIVGEVSGPLFRCKVLYSR